LTPGLTPAQLTAAYGLNAITLTSSAGKTVKGDGSGETIALIEAYNDPTIASDLHTFDQRYGLPDPTLTVVNQSGGAVSLVLFMVLWRLRPRRESDHHQHVHRCEHSDGARLANGPALVSGLVASTLTTPLTPVTGSGGGTTSPTPTPTPPTKPVGGGSGHHHRPTHPGSRTVKSGKKTHAEAPARSRHIAQKSVATKLSTANSLRD